MKVLQQEDADALRLRVISENLEQLMIPLLEALNTAMGNTSSQWAESCACCMGLLTGQLESAATAISERQVF